MPPDASREPNLFNLDQNTFDEFGELSAGEYVLRTCCTADIEPDQIQFLTIPSPHLPTGRQWLLTFVIASESWRASSRSA